MLLFFFGWMLIPRQLRNCRERKMHKRERIQWEKRNEFTETGSALYAVRWVSVFEFVRVWWLVNAREQMYTENHITAHWSRCVSVLSTVIIGCVYLTATVQWYEWRRRRATEWRSQTRTCLQNDSKIFCFAMSMQQANKNIFMWVFSLSISLPLSCILFVRSFVVVAVFVCMQNTT